MLLFEGNVPIPVHGAQLRCKRVHGQAEHIQDKGLVWVDGEMLDANVRSVLLTQGRLPTCGTGVLLVPEWRRGPAR